MIKNASGRAALATGGRCKLDQLCGQIGFTYIKSPQLQQATADRPALKRGNTEAAR